MVHLLDTSRKFRLAAAIDDDSLCSKTFGGSHGIHCYVATSDHYGFLPKIYGSVVFVIIGMHEICTRKELICRENPIKVFPFDAHESGQACSGADEDGVVSLLVEKVVDGHGASDDDVGLYLDAKPPDCFHLFGYDPPFGQTEFRDAVDKHAPYFMQASKIFTA